MNGRAQGAAQRTTTSQGKKLRVVVVVAVWILDFVVDVVESNLKTKGETTAHNDGRCYPSVTCPRRRNS